MFAAILLAFQHRHSYLFFCCYALDFQTLLPTTFVLLRSGVSNITSDYISAARLLISTTNSPYYVCCCNAPDFLALLPVDCCYAFDFQPLLPTTFLLLRSWLSNITSPLLFVASPLAFKYYLLPSTFLLLHFGVSNVTSNYVLVATLLAFQHNFRLCFCCYALGFPPRTRPTNYVSVCCRYALGFPA